MTKGKPSSSQKPKPHPSPDLLLDPSVDLLLDPSQGLSNSMSRHGPKDGANEESRRGGIQVCHILVQHRHQADDILKMLRSGKDFKELAKKFSMCSSARNGGDLGQVFRKSLDSDFLAAFDELKPGDFSEVVRTRFGYHIIRRGET